VTVAFPFSIQEEKMANVKWIKIVTDIFDDEKMLLIDGMPDRDGIIVIWFKLLCMAGKQNNGGVFVLNDKIAYTDEMLATIFRRPLNTVRLALKTFEQFGMIEIINNTITIPNWDKHQSLDKLEQAKEKNRQRVAAYRERQKALTEGTSPDACNDYGNVTVTEGNDIDIDKEKDKEKEKENNIGTADGETTKQSEKDIESEFETLWKLYPRKEGKKNALTAYKRARKKGTTFEQVKDGITAYAGVCVGRDPRYIKQGSTWFNGECWNDEIGGINNGNAQAGRNPQSGTKPSWGGNII
jgi:predicted phage replisome organizer